MRLANCNFIGEVLDRATYVVRRNWAVILIKRKENFLMMCVEDSLVPRPHPKIGKGAWCYLQIFPYVPSQHITQLVLIITFTS